MTLNSLRDALPYMTPQTRKVIVNSKLRGQINPYLPLLINQSQAVKKKVEVILMRINKIMYGKKYFKVNNDAICKEINLPNLRSN